MESISYFNRLTLLTCFNQGPKIHLFTSSIRGEDSRQLLAGQDNGFKVARVGCVPRTILNF